MPILAMRNDFNESCSVAVRAMLLTLFSVGLRFGVNAELEDLLFVLRLLHPKSLAVDICEVRLLIQSQSWIEALRLVRQIEDRGNGSPVLAALESWCLYSLGDCDWRRCAAVALRTDDATALAIVAKFIGISGEPVRDRVAEALGSDFM